MKRSLKRGLKTRLFVTFFLLVSAAGVATAESRRIVAVGDVHGAFAAFHSILHEAELVDEEGHWSGGRATLVQTGDLVDRGADSLRVVEWLMNLQEEAAAAGGEVIVLLGNHETMNLMGDMRYVTPEMMDPLVDKDSAKRRQEMCKEWTRIVRHRAKEEGSRSAPASALRAHCEEQHPLGWVEYFETMSPGAPIGSWLRSRPSAVRLDGIVFVHGGIGLELAGKPLEELNLEVYRELVVFDKIRRWLVEQALIVPSASLSEMAQAVHFVAGDDGETPDEIAPFFQLSETLLLRPDGPFWFRGYAEWSEEEGREKMPAILAELDARHVVTGHNPQDTARITPRFDDAVFLIDTGMLEEAYEGVPSALELDDGEITAIYLNGRQTLVEAVRESPSGLVGNID